MGLGHSLDQIKSFARGALHAMVRLRVPPAPNNYQVWYWDASGQYPDLSRLLRILEARGERFTGALCDQLHERFFGSERNARLVKRTCAEIEATMDRLLGRIDGAAGDADQYGRRLASFRERLDAAPEVDEIRLLVGGILGETQTMQDRVQDLETTLADSTQEITDLRESLAQAERAALTDDLTGLADRRHFDQALGTAIAEATAERTPLSLLIADVDHFKEFNDEHGHHVGDQVLRAVADMLVRSIKGRDLAARHGGEEFAVILPDTTLEGARAVGEQLCAAVRACRVRVRATGEELGRITLSIGAAQYRRGEAPSALVRRADDALYRAKTAGRDRVGTETRGGAAA